MDTAWFGLAGSLLGVLAALARSEASLPLGWLARVDHLVYGTPDLEKGVQQIEELLGVRATVGGKHPGRGTHNALIALGIATYLEIIGPDPDQPQPEGRRVFGIDELEAPQLVRWAAKANDLERLVGDAARHGVVLGDVTAGSRQRPDGVRLAWHYTDPRTVVGDGIVPFFIDWGDSPHPALTAAQGGELIALRAEHPQPERLRALLGSLGIALSVTAAATPALIATIAGKRGPVELR